jgi:hypothetical protein
VVYSWALLYTHFALVLIKERDLAIRAVSISILTLRGSLHRAKFLIGRGGRVIKGVVECILVLVLPMTGELLDAVLMLSPIATHTRLEICFTVLLVLEILDLLIDVLQHLRGLVLELVDRHP